MLDLLRNGIDLRGPGGGRGSRKDVAVPDAGILAERVGDFGGGVVEVVDLVGVIGRER